MQTLSEDFEYLGRYSIPEAGRLFKALEAAEISVEAEFDDGSGHGEFAAAWGSFGAEAGVEVAVESARRPDVDTIHARLFGAGLPTLPEGYDGNEGEELSLRQRREVLAQELGGLGNALKTAINEGRPATSCEDMITASQSLKKQIAEIDQALKANA